MLSNLFNNLPLEFWILIFVISFACANLIALLGHGHHRHRVYRGKHWFFDHTMAKHKKEIMHYAFLHGGVVTNNIVELLCRVSDATATRYLQSLEDEKQLKQIGKTGRSVFYEIR
jgi:Fic family protein